MAMLPADDPNLPDAMRDMFGPEMVDQQLRQTIHLCRMSLPADKRSIDEIERQMKRLLDRAIRDMREDFDAFGFGGH